MSEAVESQHLSKKSLSTPEGRERKGLYPRSSPFNASLGETSSYKYTLAEISALYNKKRGAIARYWNRSGQSVRLRTIDRLFC